MAFKVCLLDTIQIFERKICTFHKKEKETNFIQIKFICVHMQTFLFINVCVSLSHTLTHAKELEFFRQRKLLDCFPLLSMFLFPHSFLQPCLGNMFPAYVYLTWRPKIWKPRSHQNNNITSKHRERITNRLRLYKYAILHMFSYCFRFRMRMLGERGEKITKQMNILFSSTGEDKLSQPSTQGAEVRNEKWKSYIVKRG